MGSMFKDSLFDQDIHNWNVSKVTACTTMFDNAPIEDYPYPLKQPDLTCYHG